VLDASARPVASTLVEIWQANAPDAIRIRATTQRADRPELHRLRAHDDRPEGAIAHHDPTRRYPWRNHYNAWRPAHIHFSLFGRRYRRGSSAMYFPGDPLLDYDPMYTSIPD